MRRAAPVAPGAARDRRQGDTEGRVAAEVVLGKVRETEYKYRGQAGNFKTLPCSNLDQVLSLLERIIKGIKIKGALMNQQYCQ